MGLKQVRGPKASQGPRCLREFLLTSQLATETNLGPGVQTGLGVGPAPSRSQSLRDGGEEKLCRGQVTGLRKVTLPGGWSGTGGNRLDDRGRGRLWRTRVGRRERTPGHAPGEALWTG